MCIRDRSKSDQDKANLFAKYLSEVFTPHSTIQHNVHNLKVEQDLSIIIQVHGHLTLFTAKEIIDEINKLNQKNTQGIKRITARMLKNCQKMDSKAHAYI